MLPHTAAHRVPTEGVASLLEMQIDPRMQYLDSSLMRRYRELYNVDVVHHVAGIMINKMLSAGMRIRRAGFLPSQETRSKYEQVFSQFVTRVVESMWCFGFAAIIGVDDPDIGRAPAVLSLELLRVGVHVDYVGRYSYVFYEANFMHGIHGQASITYRPIPDVTVHTFTPPSPDGTIHSCMSRITPYFNQMLIATEADLRAIVSNSAPSLWTQSQLPKFGGGTNMTSQGGTSTRAAAVASQDNNGIVNNIGVATSGRAEPILPVAVMAASDTDARQSRMLARMPQLDEGMRVMKLPDGQDGHAFAAAPEPTYLPHYVEKFEQSVASAFKVPVTLFSADKLIRRDRTGHSRRLESEILLFEQNVRVLQQKMLRVVNDVSEKLYGARFREDALLMSIKTPAYADVASASPQTQWEFETLISPATVRELWLEGSFKRDEYILYMAQHYGIDPICFEPKPQMSLLDLNGVKPPPPPPVGGAGKPKQQGTKRKKAQASK